MVLRHTELTGLIIDKAKEVFAELGPGQTKNRYTRALQARLRAEELDAWRDFNVRQDPKGRSTLIGTLSLKVADRVGVTVAKAQGEPSERQRKALRKLCTVQGLEVGLVLNFTPRGVWAGRA